MDNEFIASLKIQAEADMKSVQESINDIQREIDKKSAHIKSLKIKLDKESNSDNALGINIDRIKENISVAEQELQSLYSQRQKLENKMISTKERNNQKILKAEKTLEKEQIKIQQNLQKQQEKLENAALKRKQQALEKQRKAELDYQKELLNGTQQTQALAKKNKNVARADVTAATKNVNKVAAQTGNSAIIDTSTKMSADSKSLLALEKERLINQNNINKAAQQETLIRQQQNENYRQQMTLLREIEQNERKILSLGKEKGSSNKQEIQDIKQATLAKIEELKAIQNTVPLTKQQEKAIEQARQEQQRLTQEAQKSAKALKETSGHAKSLGDYMKNVANYVFLYQALNMVQQAVQNAYETIVNLDTAFTDIQMVTGYSESQIGDLSQEYNDLAKQMGSTTQEVAEGATEWFNESRDHVKVLELLETP